jgi:hypothetical protein
MGPHTASPGDRNFLRGEGEGGPVIPRHPSVLPHRVVGHKKPAGAAGRCNRDKKIGFFRVVGGQIHSRPGVEPVQSFIENIPVGRCVFQQTVVEHHGALTSLPREPNRRPTLDLQNLHGLKRYGQGRDFNGDRQRHVGGGV